MHQGTDLSFPSVDVLILKSHKMSIMILIKLLTKMIEKNSKILYNDLRVYAMTRKEFVKMI